MSAPNPSPGTAKVTATRDMYHIAYLLYEGKEIVAVDRNNPQRVRVIFAGDHSELLDRWDAGLVMVQGLRYVANLRRARRIVLGGDHDGKS